MDSTVTDLMVSDLDDEGGEMRWLLCPSCGNGYGPGRFVIVSGTDVLIANKVKGCMSCGCTSAFVPQMFKSAGQARYALSVIQKLNPEGKNILLMEKNMFSFPADCLVRTVPVRQAKVDVVSEGGKDEQQENFFHVQSRRR